jgi:hypothetical protein
MEKCRSRIQYLLRMRHRSSDDVRIQAEEFLDQGWLPSPHTPGRLFPAEGGRASKMASIDGWAEMRAILARER